MSDIDDFNGPTLEAHISSKRVMRAGCMWDILMLSDGFGEVRITLDWNGMNARNWDQSFVPLMKKEYKRLDE